MAHLQARDVSVNLLLDTSSRKRKKVRIALGQPHKGIIMLFASANNGNVYIIDGKQTKLVYESGHVFS